MAKTGSYIKLDRGLKTNPIWLEKPFSKGQAWVDLLLLAQGIETDKHYRGKVQHMKPGVVYTSILYLSSRWGWGRNKVYRFLDTLIKAEMIVIQGRTSNDTINRTRNGTYNGTTNGTIISIENWERYQNVETNDETENETRNGTTNRTSDGTHNRKHIRESNKEKAIKNKSRSAPETPSEKNDSHLRLTADEGTVDDIPDRYRDMFDNFADYWRYRNQ